MDEAAGAQAKVKGNNLTGLVRALKTLRGEAVVAKTIAALPKIVRENLSQNRIMPGDWYPVEWSSQLHIASQVATSEGVALSRALGKEAARQDFQGIYKVFFAVVTPQFIVKRAPGIWDTYWDNGTMTVSEVVAGRAVAKWAGCKHFNRFLWHANCGGVEAALEAAGAKQVKVQLTSGGRDGEETAQLEATWK